VVSLKVDSKKRGKCSYELLPSQNTLLLFLTLQTYHHSTLVAQKTGYHMGNTALQMVNMYLNSFHTLIINKLKNRRNILNTLETTIKLIKDS